MTIVDPWESRGTLMDERVGTPAPQFRELPVAATNTLPSSTYEEFVTTSVRLPPRKDAEMLDRAKRVGALLGENAFYSWRQGGENIEGASIDLAYALAGEWGFNVTRVALLSDDGTRVHLRGSYIDLQRISIVERDYIAHLSAPKGKFADKEDQRERWKVMELQKASSKAVRGAILGGLPAWFVQAALDEARRAANNSATGGKPLPEARAGAIKALEQFGLKEDELVTLLGRPADLWVAPDLAKLRRMFGELRDGTLTVEQLRAEIASAKGETTPAAKPTGADALGIGKKKPAETAKPEPAATTTTAPAGSDEGGMP